MLLVDFFAPMNLYCPYTYITQWSPLNSLKIFMRRGRTTDIEFLIVLKEDFQSQMLNDVNTKCYGYLNAQCMYTGKMTI